MSSPPTSPFFVCSLKLLKVSVAFLAATNGSVLADLSWLRLRASFLPLDTCSLVF